MIIIYMNGWENIILNCHQINISKLKWNTFKLKFIKIDDELIYDLYHQLDIEY
jgi:hypothetical protein